MKDYKAVNINNKVQTNDEENNCEFNKSNQKLQKKRPAFKVTAVLIATAMVLSLALLGNFLLNSLDVNNIFSIKTFAMEQQREVDLLKHPNVMGGYHDGEYLYLNIGLRSEGKNIASVEFSTEDGFFARQLINKENDEKVSKVYAGENNTLVSYGSDFEKLSNKFTLNYNLEEDYMFFWGIESDDIENSMPETISIHAVVTFDDGKTQEENILMNMEKPMIFGGYSEPTREEIERRDYNENIPLEQCELIPESVKIVKDGDEYYTSSGSAIVITESHILFDENGISRIGSSTSDEGVVIISIIQRDEDGVMTGMQYRAPDWTYIKNYKDLSTYNTSEVLVDGEEVSFDAYTIEGNNYFKLRDIAKAITGSDKQFNVTWDNTNKAINLVSNQAYKEVGGELDKGDGQLEKITKSPSMIYIDGESIDLTAYKINDNNYFKLRDIAEAFDIGVTWDEETKTIGIDTGIGYN